MDQSVKYFISKNKININKISKLAKHKFEIVNNYDNYKDLNVLEFIRDVGRF